MKMKMNNMNPRFMQPLLPSFLSSFSIPIAYMKKHLELNLSGDPLQIVVLMTEDEPQRGWIVTVEGGRHFKDGWKQFCDHHNFQVGDFLVFIHKTQLIFQVIVFDPITACQRPSASSDARSREEATAVPPEHPPIADCQIILTRYKFQQSIIFFPATFVRKTGLNERTCEMLIIDDKERRWPVKLNYKKSDGQSYVKIGWKAIQVANSYRLGNVICFQLLKSGNRPILKCHKKNMIGQNLKSRSKTRTYKARAESVATVQSGQSQTKYPCFLYRLSASSAITSIFFLPLPFGRQNNLNSRSCKVKMIDERGRKWQVKMNYRKRDGQPYFYAGWKDVRDTNRFKAGDTICFELREAAKMPVFKCHRVKQ